MLGDINPGSPVQKRNEKIFRLALLQMFQVILHLVSTQIVCVCKCACALRLHRLSVLHNCIIVSCPVAWIFQKHWMSYLHRFKMICQSFRTCSVCGCKYVEFLRKKRCLVHRLLERHCGQVAEIWNRKEALFSLHLALEVGNSRITTLIVVHMVLTGDRVQATRPIVTQL